ncbi:DUF58 domain-containing protein [Halosimplex salinum]|uniref:DUF58 domain-containing protein n=1 Tax=Halosimplex salinum TaxID=1710538 RepID=UPI000F4ABA4F|nr:DUF58 domain-containing protein [Halosimplex salinum]
MSYERVSRWRVGAIAAATLVALGLLYASPLLLAATVIPLGYVVYGSLSTVSPEAAVRFDRSFETATPPPGEAVTVRLTVENDSAATLPDLRVVDGVPDDLAVVEGTPRGCFALRPGESATVTYDVVARRGDFQFADPLVRLRPLSAGRVVTETVPAAGETTLSSLDPVSAAPVGSVTTARTGTHPVDSGGEGLEFRSTREYRPGDSINRIHWRRFARTGELTTVSFREEQAIRVVVVVDARPVGRVRPRAGTPTAASLAGYASERIYETLAEENVTTSLAAFGVDGADPSVPTGAGPVPWVDGERANATAVARTVFEAVRQVADDSDGEAGVGGRGDGTRRATDAPSVGGRGRPTGTGATADGQGASEPAPAGAASPPEAPAPDGGADDVRMLLSQFPGTARVLFVTPLLDDWPVSFVRRLRRRDYPVTVLSPDGTGSDSIGGTVVARERDVRLADLSATGATAVDWDRTESIEVALSAALSNLSGGPHD